MPLELRLPHLRLDIDALDQNLAMMTAWCAAEEVLLAPHIKTTMSRPIVERQLAAGAWGVTVATAAQAATASAWGCRRILVANEVVDGSNLRILRRLLEADPELDLLCFADSIAGVTVASAALTGSGRRLGVLVDIGRPAGRTGVRDAETANQVAMAVVASAGLELRGVAGYEGVAPNLRDDANIAGIDEHCARTTEAYLALAPLVESANPIYSMGGSAFPDRVALAMPGSAEVAGTLRVMRSGCYATHDHGVYSAVSPIAGLVSALTVRAVVVSHPEPNTVVIGAGKRELASDAGLPVVLGALTPDGLPRNAAGTASKIFDHHLVIESAVGLTVGDTVELGISHPCSEFDRWDSYLATAAGQESKVWSTDFDRNC
jgi:D-serine deaminase-like pyridoxal phosphate-dependent protein